jgi:hypothetical protein
MENIEQYLKEVHEKWHGSPFSVGVVHRDGPEGAWQERFFGYGLANASGRKWDEDVGRVSVSVRRGHSELTLDHLQHCFRVEALCDHRGWLVGRGWDKAAQWEQAHVEYSYEGCL